MINYLYANGCSWTFGNGIDEDPIFNGTTLTNWKLTHARYAWPAVLGRHLNCKTKNDAWGAGSNKRILRTTIDFIQNYPKEEYENLCVAIGWTTIERDEIYVEREDYNRWYNFNAAQKFSDQFPRDITSDEKKSFNKIIDQYQKQYVTWIHNNYSDIIYYFQQVYLLRNLLENLGIKYIFFNALPWTWLPENEIILHQPKFELLNSSNLFKMSPADPMTMMSFCSDNNLTLSSCMHPLVNGHAGWADTLFDEIKRLYPNEFNTKAS